jgi:hypothetical protein
MGFTPNYCLGVFSGIPPVAEIFVYVNFRYLVTAFNVGFRQETARILEVKYKNHTKIYTAVPKEKKESVTQ